MLKIKTTLKSSNGVKQKEKLTNVGNKLLLKKDLAAYIRVSFIPIYFEDECLCVGYCGETSPSVKWLESRYKKKIRLKRISSKSFVKILQKNFSEHLLERSTNSFANKQPKSSAKKTLSKNQKYFFCLIFFVILAAFIIDKSKATSALVLFCNVVFLFNTTFKTMLFFINKKKESFVDMNIKLPIYSIILPVFNEEKYVIEGLLKSIKNLDYPKEKLDVKLVVEQFDRKTLSGIRQLKLPKYINIICVKAGFPKTKPKACN